MKRAFTRAIGAMSVLLVLALAARAGDAVQVRGWFMRDPVHANERGFLSEYGVSGAVNLPRLLRHYKHQGKEGADDAHYYRGQFPNDANWRAERLLRAALMGLDRGRRKD